MKQKKLLMYGGLGAVGILLITAFVLSESSAQSVICLPGTHLEGELCVPDILPVSCPSGYALSAATCKPVLPAPDPDISMHTLVSVTDRSVASADYNVMVYIPQHFTGKVNTHLRVIDAGTNVEFAHEQGVRQFTNTGEGNYINNYFRTSHMKPCTTYNVFAYATSDDDSRLYSENMRSTAFTTKGCPASFLSTFSFFDWLSIA